MSFSFGYMRLRFASMPSFHKCAYTQLQLFYHFAGFYISNVYLSLHFLFDFILSFFAYVYLAFVLFVHLICGAPHSAVYVVI